VQFILIFSYILQIEVQELITLSLILKPLIKQRIYTVICSSTFGMDDLVSISWQ